VACFVTVTQVFIAKGLGRQWEPGSGSNKVGQANGGAPEDRPKKKAQQDANPQVNAETEKVVDRGKVA